MRIFSAVAATGSFTAGAGRAGVSTRVASSYVAQLERRLGARLLARTTRSVRLTAAGEAYLGRCNQLLHDFDELEGAVRERESVLAGRIRITAPTAIGSSRLAPALHDFLAAHPQVSVDLQLSDRVVSVVDEGFDLAIRLGVLADSGLVARRLAPLPFIVCAAPTYLQARGTPAHPHALATHECLINTGLNQPHHWRFAQAGARFEVRVDGRFHANAPLAVAEMAAKGLGIGWCPAYVIEEHLRAGRVMRLLQDFESHDGAIHAVYPANRHLSARVRSVIDHLQQRWGGHATATAGVAP